MPEYDASLFTPPAPVAIVRLRTSDSETDLIEVPMLIDSGADVTLVPQSAVDLLGPGVDLNQSYELMSFDGTTSSARAVQLQLVFLRRIFTGRFLVIQQKCGILGRDVLNHVFLVLEGPLLT